MNSITFLGTHKSGVVVVLVLSESEVFGLECEKHMLGHQHVMTHDA